MEVMVARRAFPPRSDVLRATFSPRVRSSISFLSPKPCTVSRSCIVEGVKGRERNRRTVDKGSEENGKKQERERKIKGIERYKRENGDDGREGE